MAVKISEIKDKVNALIRENEEDAEFISQIGQITKDLDEFESDYIDFLGKHQDLRNKYIEVCKNASFSPTTEDDEVGKESEPPSLESLVENISNRKEN